MRLIERLRWWAHECDRTNHGCQAREMLLEAADEIERFQSQVEENIMHNKFPCLGCEVGWGSLSSEGCMGCENTCEKLAKWRSE